MGFPDRHADDLGPGLDLHLHRLESGAEEMESLDALGVNEAEDRLGRDQARRERGIEAQGIDQR